MIGLIILTLTDGTIVFFLFFFTKSSCVQRACLYNSYTLVATDFADIYTQSPRATGPRVFISVKSQAAMVSTNIYHSHQCTFIYKAHFASIVVYYVRATITR